MLYVFGDYTLDTECYELRRIGVRLRIEPRVFDLLAYLVQRQGHTIAKDELCTQLWPDQPSISDDRLTNCVAQARKVLGDTGQSQRFIQTVHSRGYRFIAPVTTRPHREADPTSTSASPIALSPHTERTESTLAAARPGILAAERCRLTVVVCHVLGFAELAASRDPEALIEVTRDYHAMCAEVVHQFAGHIAQVQWDGLVVYFGWPQTHEDDARHAVQTGLSLVEGMERLKQRHTQDWGVQPATQVGIHTGLVVMSALGHGDSREPLALGTTPAIAAQVQGLAAPDTVVITSTTLRLVERYFVCQPMGTHRVDTLSLPLTVYQVLQVSPAQSRFEVTVTKGMKPLVGRDQEVALLREHWSQAKDGQGQIVVLSGEAGIGKSRLAQAFKESLAGEAHTRIECHCSPDYQQSALYPVVEHLRQLLRLRGGETPEEQLQTLEAALAPMDMPLAEVVPLFAALLLLPPPKRYAPQPLTPVQQKQQTFAALLAWLLQEAERQPVCYIMEDLHWADPSTLEWCSLLIDQIRTARVLLLLLFRPDFRPPLVAHSHCTHLALGRLSHRQTEGMIRHVVGGKPLPAEVIQQLVAKTDGVPLFVEELTKIVVESGLVKEGEGRYELTSPLPLLAIPATLHDSLMARLDRLGPAKQVAQLGAVMGREFAYEVLQVVAPMEETTLQQGLARLVDAELLYQRGLPPQARYMFKHALIQEAAYQSLLRSTRRQYHQQIAQVLAAQFPEMVDNHPELMARHYTEAGLGAQAVPYWQRAGQHALERSGTIGNYRDGRSSDQGAGVAADPPGDAGAQSARTHAATCPGRIALNGAGPGGP
jgi:class 3 adenylate cyclase